MRREGDREIETTLMSSTEETYISGKSVGQKNEPERAGKQKLDRKTTRKNRQKSGSLLFRLYDCLLPEPNYKISLSADKSRTTGLSISRITG